MVEKLRNRFQYGLDEPVSLRDIKCISGDLRCVVSAPDERHVRAKELQLDSRARRCNGGCAIQQTRGCDVMSSAKSDDGLNDGSPRRREPFRCGVGAPSVPQG